MENEIGEAILGAAMKVHSALGPGLLESVYEVCLAYELEKQGHEIRRQVSLPVEYDGKRIDAGFRPDILVADKVLVEVKAVERMAPDSYGTNSHLSQAKWVQTRLSLEFQCRTHA